MTHLKLPLISIERTNIIKDPETKRVVSSTLLFRWTKTEDAGRFVIAKRIVPDKTRNFAVACRHKNEQ